MDLVGVVEVQYQGQPILGLFFGEVFVWPDPWWDTWDEGTSVLWQNVWHNRWSEE
jgi:hypothetical protein